MKSQDYISQFYPIGKNVHAVNFKHRGMGFTGTYPISNEGMGPVDFFFKDLKVVDHGMVTWAREEHVVALLVDSDNNQYHLHNLFNGGAYRIYRLLADGETTQPGQGLVFTEVHQAMETILDELDDLKKGYRNPTTEGTVREQLGQLIQRYEEAYLSFEAEFLAKTDTYVAVKRMPDTNKPLVYYAQSVYDCWAHMYVPVHQRTRLAALAKKVRRLRVKNPKDLKAGFYVRIWGDGETPDVLSNTIRVLGRDKKSCGVGGTHFRATITDEWGTVLPINHWSFNNMATHSLLLKHSAATEALVRELQDLTMFDVYILFGIKENDFDYYGPRRDCVGDFSAYMHGLFLTSSDSA